MSRSYKFWYRMAQSIIQYYHTPRLPEEQKRILLNTALTKLNNALYCLSKFEVPTAQQIKNFTNFTNLQEEDVDAIIMKMRS